MFTRVFFSSTITLLLFGVALGQVTEPTGDAPVPATPAPADLDRGFDPLDAPIAEEAGPDADDETGDEVVPDELDRPNEPVPNDLNIDDQQSDRDLHQDAIENADAFPNRPTTPAENRLGNSSADRNRDRAALGVVLGNGPYGVWVQAVFANTPACEAGLRRGDRIDTVNGTRYNSANGLTEEIGRLNPGDTLTLHVWRNGRLVELTPKLGNRREVFAQNASSARSEQSRSMALRPIVEDPNSDELRQRLQALQDEVATLREQVNSLKAELESQKAAAASAVEEADEDDSLEEADEPSFPEESNGEPTDEAIPFEDTLEN